MNQTDQIYQEREKQRKIQEAIGDIPYAWDIRKTVDLEALKYEGLRNIWYGKYNIVVPSEMLDLENPSEILANYLSAGVLKFNNNHKKRSLPKDFSKLVKLMNRVAFDPQRRACFLRMHTGSKKRFSTNPKDQELRLREHLSDEAKQEFVDSFYEDYRPYKGARPTDPDAFEFDPQSKRTYRDWIYAYFQNRFAQAHPTHPQVG